MIRVVSSNSNEENSFGETLKKKSLLLLTKTVSNFMTHPNTSALRNISKTSASVSSGFQTREKLMKARGRRPSAFIVFECLKPR